MKNFLWVMRTTLRTALWRSTEAERPVSVSTVLVFATLAMVSEAARQYLAVDSPAAFSIYGVNSIIAAMAVFVAIASLFISKDRAVVLAQLAALATLLEWLLIAAGRIRVPIYNPMPGIWTESDKVVLAAIVVVVWWVGAVAVIFRRAGIGPYQSPVLRAFWLCAVAGAAIVALPAFPTFLGRDYNPSSNDSAPIDVAAVELSQPHLVEAEIKKLLPERKGTTDIYAIGIAGWSDQDVFIKELNGGLSILSRSLGIDRGTMRLVNHRDTLATTPVATRTNFAAAVHAVAGIMNKDEDILVVFITSHGGPTGVGLFLGNSMTAVLSPDHVASVLDREGIRNRVVIVSACYSGIFAKRLASADSIVLTAADENSTSFGCSNEREWTYFGDAFFNQSLSEGVSLEQAFEDAKAKISQWETRDELPPSSPQGHFGAVISDKLAKLKLGKKMQAFTEER
jgi:hypothetical protein